MNEKCSVDLLVIEVDGQRQVIELRHFLSIDENSIEKELIENPAQYAYYASVLGWYENLYSRVEDEIAVLEAKKDLEIRQEGGGELKEREVRSRLLLDRELREKKEYLFQIDEVVRKLRALVKGIEKKGDRLAQLYSKWKLMGLKEGGL